MLLVVAAVVGLSKNEHFKTMLSLLESLRKETQPHVDSFAACSLLTSPSGQKGRYPCPALNEGDLLGVPCDPSLINAQVGAS